MTFEATGSSLPGEWTFSDSGNFVASEKAVLSDQNLSRVLKFPHRTLLSTTNLIY
jgi:hypothetical protein